MSPPPSPPSPGLRFQDVEEERQEWDELLVSLPREMKHETKNEWLEGEVVLVLGMLCGPVREALLKGVGLHGRVVHERHCDVGLVIVASHSGVDFKQLEAQGGLDPKGLALVQRSLPRRWDAKNG